METLYTGEWLGRIEWIEDREAMSPRSYSKLENYSCFFLLSLPLLVARCCSHIIKGITDYKKDDKLFFSVTVFFKRTFCFFSI